MSLLAQVHFFKPAPKEYLHSAELRDIMQFGSSSTAVFFKMRVAGVLHIFQFETKLRQGEEMCLALTTHINDVMHRRYAKRSMNLTGQEEIAPPEKPEEPQPPQVLPEVKSPGVSVATYERTIQEMSSSLEKANTKIDLVRFSKMYCFR